MSGDFQPGAGLAPAEIAAVTTFITLHHGGASNEQVLAGMKRFFEGGLLSEIKADIARIKQGGEP